jgi:hypothetical protein
LDEDSFDNTIHSNTIADIDDPEDALGVEDDAGDRNTLYFNMLLDSTSGSKTELSPNLN